MTNNLKIISLFFIIPFLFASTLLAANKKPIGAVVAWTGDVYIYHEGESQGAKVKGMEGIYYQDTIITSNRSRVKILMKDDSILSLGENGRLVIKDYLLEEASDERVSTFKIFAGKVRTLVGRVFRGGKSHFRVETPTAIAGIKGTDFIVSTTEGESEIVSISGEVAVRNISPSIPDEVVLKPRLGTKIQDGMSPSTPAEIPSGRLNALIEETSIPVTAAIELREAGCAGCHEKIYSAKLRYKKQHLETSEQCQICHIKDLAVVREIPINDFTRGNLIFLDVSDIVNYKVRVKVKDREGKEAESQEISFIPSSIYEKMLDDKKPPVISNIKVEEVKAGVFYSATITWETDEPSTSQLEYGPSKKYGFVSPPIDRYTNEHRVIIERLEPGEKYHIRAISKDVFDNIVRSDDFTFKVKKPFLEKQDEPNLKPSVDNIKVVKIGEKTALFWKANKKTTSQVELAEVVSRKNIASEEPHYPGLTTKKFAGLDGCISGDCHKGSIHKKTTHPTGLLSWHKVTPAPDLPLAGGTMMLCSTCHTPHGGDHNHILRKAENNLCISCHR